MVLDDLLLRATARAQESGCPPVAAVTGAALRTLTAAVGAKAVVEVGTGTGVSGLWLVRGMAPDGVLTSIDIEPEHQRQARDLFAQEGVRTNRARLITGDGLEVLPRLTDGAYDVVFLDAEPEDLDAFLNQAMRLLRPGGLLAVHNALWRDKVADPAKRDPQTTAIREAVKRVRGDESLRSCLLPIGEGLLVAVKR